MPLVDELGGAEAGLADALAADLWDISQQREIEFRTYTRRVLPLDGFVFWLRTGTFTTNGMVHHSAERPQNEDDTATSSAVLFTTIKQIVQLNQTSPDTLIVGIVEGVKYAFRTHGWFAEQAGLWHYTGSSLVAPLATQLVDAPAQIDPTKLIVSDSLPAWLSLISYTPVWLVPPNPLIMLYPSYAVPANLLPPYGAVHIEPENIRALQASPLLRPVQLPLLDGFGLPVRDGNGNPITFTGTRHTQLTQERVRVTLYGCNNDMAQDFLDLVLRYSLDTDIIGMMNMPTVRDEKRIWAEGMILAQKKTIEFEISHIQHRTIGIAQQLIREAATTVQAFPFSAINPPSQIDYLLLTTGDALQLESGGGLILAGG